jgi:nucleoside-diphosphate-sugar epimerase
MAFRKFINALIEGREIAIYSDGTQTRDFTYVDDIVVRLVLAQKAPAGAVMSLGGGNRVSLAEAIATLCEVMGVELQLVRQPVEAGDVCGTWAHVSRAVALVGYRPPTKLPDGLAWQYAWLAEARNAVQ